MNTEQSTAQTKKKGSWKPSRSTKHLKLSAEKKKDLFLRIQGMSKYEDDCIVWIAYCSKPSSILAYAQDGKNRYAVSVRRFLYTYNGRRLGDDQVVRMSCGNPLCIKQTHMYLSTKKELANANRDKSATKHRMASQVAAQRRSPLTIEDVREIRNSSEPTRFFAEKFKVTCAAISAIRRHINWKERFFQL